MKFVVSSSALLALLQNTCKVVNAKNTLPILDYFLFDLKGSSLSITASDLETTLVGSIEVDSVEREGLIAAPVRRMLDSLKEFSEQPITIEADESTWEIVVSWATGKLSIPGTSGLSYPELPSLEEENNSFEIPVENLLEGINKTIFATADDELRPVMNGVFINIGNAEVTYVATDAHKLVKHISPLDSQISASFILPKKPAALLRALLSKEDADIKVMFDGKNVQFKLEGLCYNLVCRLIEGNYPNYNAVIPTNNPNKVSVDRLELLNGIRRVAVCSNQATHLVKLNIADNCINIEAQDIDFSVSAHERVACSYDSTPISIGFKSTFLIEILGNIDTPEVVIELADSTRAGVMKPVGQQDQEGSTLMLLMPMMIA